MEENKKEPPMSIVVDGLYTLNKNGGRYSGKEVKVTKLLPGKEVVGTVIDKHGEHCSLKFGHAELFAMKHPDGNEEGGKKLVFVEKATILPKQERIRNAMDNNEDLRVASRIFVKEMAQIALDDDSALFAVLNAAKNRLRAVDHAGHKKDSREATKRAAAPKRKAVEVVDIAGDNDSDL